MAQTMAYWFRQHYKLSPRDPLFLALTPEQVETEYWAHQFFNKPPGVEEFENEDFDKDAVLAAVESDEDWEDLINDRA
jgi:hypothetical protein